MVEQSEHSLQDVMENSPNEAARALYEQGSFEWVNDADLWSVSVCQPSHFYHVEVGRCVRRRSDIALFTGLMPLAIMVGEKKTLTSWNISLSIWAHHLDGNNTAVLIEIVNVAALNWEPFFPDHLAQLQAQYGWRGSKNITVHNMSGELANTKGRWHYYALSTAFLPSGSNSSTFVWNDVTSPALPIGGALPATLQMTNFTIILGNSLRGYVRDAKVWTRTLTPEDIYNEKYL